MKINKWELIATIALIIVLFFYIKSTIKHNKELTEINTLYKVSQDSMVTYRNKLGEQVAKVEPLITTNQEYFLKIKSQDHEINDLQELLKAETKKRRDVEVAIVISNQTIYNLKDSLKNKIIAYVKKDSLIYPTYEHKTSDKWLEQDIQIGINSFNQKLLVKNDYNITIGQEKSGWFKMKPYAEIVNLNPASETKAIRVYQKKEVPSKFWPFVKGGIVGAGIVWLIKLL
jgi:hypothetical protein